MGGSQGNWVPASFTDCVAFARSRHLSVLVSHNLEGLLQTSFLGGHDEVGPGTRLRSSMAVSVTSPHCGAVPHGGAGDLLLLVAIAPGFS